MKKFVQFACIAFSAMLLSACSKTEKITSIIGLKAWVEYEYVDENEDGVNDIAKLTFHAKPSEHATVDFNDISLSWDGTVVHMTNALPTEYSLDLDLSIDSAHTFSISCRNTQNGASYRGTLPVVAKTGEVIIETSIDFEHASTIEIS